MDPKTSLFYIFSLILCTEHDVEGFDDSVLFDLNFPGDLGLVESDDYSESMLVTSSLNEKYQCFLPNIIKKEESPLEPYLGPSPLELISPLFTQGTCSYRLESYWTYQVCHGKYIRQYHEEREGKKVKLQEYLLGKWDEKHFERLLEKSRLERDDLKENVVINTKKIDNVNLPYFELTMDNGTACDLNYNKPRTTKVVYVCFIHGKHEVYLLKETSTCSYEIIILTPLLCSHPKYKPKDTDDLKINCVPMEGASDEPYSLRKLKLESAKLRKNAEFDRLKNQQSDGYKVELIQFKSEDAVTGGTENKKSPTFVNGKVGDTSPVKEFLQGKHCLYGGTGWWKFEFCYGKSVEQFHIERDGSRTAINLGVFNKQKHLDWIKEHPHKRPKPVEARKQISHFYSEGSVCDKTGQPRQTEVKLKCLENAANPSSVSLYLLEPKYCEYILGVESPLICQILDKVDDNGLVQVPLDFDESESDTEYPSFTL
ncbi:endoplasmic reticulum lectin 1 isoform X1 [Euwallacea similis]|uniref:endoplasmic reticulum lectin 1 isoform X1 n=1 Tax=Euwallacea similis TaxID=1736056 RepID=UPI00344EAB68